MKLIDACESGGARIPHFCYHKALSTPGNCRMCLIEMGMPKMTPDRKPVIGPDGFPEIAWIPKPTVSCATTISEGMAVRTDSPLVVETRKGMMEFLLANHPLDCPICDQAGECSLQEYAMEHGKAASRFDEGKVKKPKHVELGPRVVYDAERCVLCSRCIRFMKEVMKDEVLGFVNRGSYSHVAAAPCKPLDSNYSLNTVDLCPVGALTAKDFRFQMRTWFLRETKTIDVHCGTGANITVSSREGKIYRVVPRHNPAVNDYWMPDSHRLAFHQDVHSEKRLLTPTIAGEPAQWIPAIEKAAKALQASQGRSAMIVSASLVNEELYMARRIAEAFGIELFDILPRPQSGDGFLISTDGNANSAGARLLGLATGRLGTITDLVAAGQIETLLVIAEDVAACGIAPADLEKIKTIISIASLSDATTARAQVVLPMVSWAEKCGTLINVKNRIQRLNAVLDPIGDSRRLWSILRDFLQEIFVRATYEDFSDVFAEMTRTVPAFAELTLAKIGDQGIELPNAGNTQ